MQRFYRAILGLYPAEYRSAFTTEMVEAFQEASASFRKRGLLEWIWFATREFAGLLKGAVAEHIAKWNTQDAYLTSRSASRPDSDEFPVEIVDIQRRLEHLIRSMEFAIAHHDFPKARFYSNEERIARALLQRLTNE